MKEIIFKYIRIVLFSAIIIFALSSVIIADQLPKQEVKSLVIFGENTDLDEAHKAFVEDGCLYVALSTFYKTVDEDIFYDELTEKIIITNSSKVAKLKVDSEVINVNFEDKKIMHKAKKVGNVVFIPLTDLLEFYDICITYNDESGIACIDKKDAKLSSVLHDYTAVYENIKTDSNILQNLKKGDEVVVYEEALVHNRWYKVRTMSGNVGYVFKHNIMLSDDEIKDVIDDKKDSEKYVMFWQYKSQLSSLGDCIDGVNVASPTVYELYNATGDVNGELTDGYVDVAHSYRLQSMANYK